jgi:hypothetical protein
MDGIPPASMRNLDRKPSLSVDRTHQLVDIDELRLELDHE